MRKRTGLGATATELLAKPFGVAETFPNDSLALAIRCPLPSCLAPFLLDIGSKILARGDSIAIAILWVSRRVTRPGSQNGPIQNDAANPSEKPPAAVPTPVSPASKRLRGKNRQ